MELIYEVSILVSNVRKIMKFSFTFKVPMRSRIRILFLGGLHISIDYNGQFKTAVAVLDAIPKKDATGKLTKESQL